MKPLRARVVRTMNTYNGRYVWVLAGLGQPLDGVVMAVGKPNYTIPEEIWESLAYLNDRRADKGLPVILAEIETK